MSDKHDKFYRILGCIKALGLSHETIERFKVVSGQLECHAGILGFGSTVAKDVQSSRIWKTGIAVHEGDKLGRQARARAVEAERARMRAEARQIRERHPDRSKLSTSSIAVLSAPKFKCSTHKVRKAIAGI